MNALQNPIWRGNCVEIEGRVFKISDGDEGIAVQFCVKRADQNPLTSNIMDSLKEANTFRESESTRRKSLQVGQAVREINDNIHISLLVGTADTADQPSLLQHIILASVCAVSCFHITLSRPQRSRFVLYLFSDHP